MPYGVTAEWDRLARVAMIRPEFFEPTEPINLTQLRFYGTPRQPSVATLLEQHAKVMQVLSVQGIQVIEVEPHPGLPYQFNIRDAAVMIGPRMMLMRMARPIRYQEPTLVADAFAATEKIATSDGTLEGGDLMLTPTEVFVGLSERSNNAGYASLHTLLGPDWRVTPIQLTHGTLHLDVAFNMLGPHIGVIYRPSISNDLPQSLRDVEWIEVTDEEFAEQAVNILVLDPCTVLMDARHERLRSELTKRGFRCLLVELDEITKVGGGVRCMTLPLHRVRAQDDCSRSET